MGQVLGGVAAIESFQGFDGTRSQVNPRIFKGYPHQNRARRYFAVMTASKCWHPVATTNVQERTGPCATQLLCHPIGC